MLHETVEIVSSSESQDDFFPSAAVDSASAATRTLSRPQPADFAGSVKLPGFWQSDPAPWFEHIEALFHLRGITDDNSRYYLVVAALDQESTRRAMQLLRAPPRREKYAALKRFLLRRYTLSAAERADKLLSLPGLGDRSAVDLMDNMLSLLGADDGGFLFPHLFLRQLPPPVRATLANSPSLTAGDFRGLAEEADRILLSSRGASVQSVTSDSPHSTTIVDPVMAAGVSTPRQRSVLCFYHRRFGAKAHRCIPPCSFQTPGNGRVSVQ